MSVPKSVPKKISDYTVLPLLHPAPSTPGAPAATSYVYLRRHAPTVPTPDTPRTLFCTNIPIDATESHLRALFTAIGGGRVERVDFADAPTAHAPPPPANSAKKRKRAGSGEEEEQTALSTWDRPLRRAGGHALVVFVDKASAEAALKAAAGARKDPPTWSAKLAPKAPALGVARYLAHHRLTFPDRAVLQASVDAFMASFAESEAETRRTLARRRQEPDEDGFVTVVRGGRVAPARQEEAKAVLERKKEEGKGKELTGFYRWQLREERKKKQQEMLAKFEEDKRLVEERKRARKFKPM